MTDVQCSTLVASLAWPDPILHRGAE